MDTTPCLDTYRRALEVALDLGYDPRTARRVAWLASRLPEWRSLVRVGRPRWRRRRA